MTGWEKHKLVDLTIDGKGHYGIAAPAIDYDEKKFTYLRITDINDDGTLNISGLKSVADPDSRKYLLKEGDIVFARTGNSTGRSYYYEPSDGEFVYAGFLIKFSLDPKKVNPRFLKYYTHSRPYYDWVKSFDTGATRGNINAQTFGAMEIKLPPRSVQDRLVEILSSIDHKIALNNRINHNLEEQAQALYKSWFIDFEPFKVGGFVNSELGMIPKGWCVIKAKDFCPINIGKTPPRKESQWFSSNRDDITWVSISDMAECGVFLDSSSETLTHDAIRSFNITIVPEGSVLLSFKLTIGRVAIAGKKLTTNEAIARFITDDSERTQYLYLTLKNYDYSKLGSTSSIATAVNSKIIRAMPLIYPGEKVICDFAQVVSSLFGEIRKRQIENKLLTEIRDTILPRLMSDRLKAVVSDC